MESDQHKRRPMQKKSSSVRMKKKRIRNPYDIISKNVLAHIKLTTGLPNWKGEAELQWRRAKKKISRGRKKRTDQVPGVGAVGEPQRS